MEYKKMHAKSYFSVTERLYATYQYQAFLSLVITGELNNDTNYFLFGLPGDSREYYSMLKKFTDKIYIVTNDIETQGEKWSETLVNSSEIMADMKDKPHKVFLTGLNIISTIRSLIETGTINNVNDLFPFNADTELERVYRDGFLQQIKILQQLPCTQMTTDR
jgi:hypothetical protein